MDKVNTRGNHRGCEEIQLFAYESMADRADARASVAL